MKALIEALELAENTLRSLIATLHTVDSDERFNAREARRSANVHTEEIWQAERCRDQIKAAIAKATEPAPFSQIGND